MLPSSLLRWCVFSDFWVSGPSLDPIFLRFSRFGAPFLIRFGLHFAATAGAMFRHSAANMLHSTGWWGYAAREELVFLKSAGDHLGTLVGVPIAPNKIIRPKLQLASTNKNKFGN